MPAAVLQWERYFSPGCLRIKGKQSLQVKIICFIRLQYDNVKKWHEDKETRRSFVKKDNIIPKGFTVCRSVIVHEALSGLNCYLEELKL